MGNVQQENLVDLHGIERGAKINFLCNANKANSKHKKMVDLTEEIIQLVFQRKDPPNFDKDEFARPETTIES
jgi:hypothetical protein